MGVATAVGLAVSAGLAVNKTIQEKKRADKAQKNIDSYQRQELNNVYANMTLPVEATRRREEALNVATQSQLDRASQAGARGLGVALPGIQDFQSREMTEIGLSFEESRFKIDQLLAKGESDRQRLTERREEADLQALGQQYEAGMQGYQSGLGDIAQTIGAGIQVAGAAGSELPSSTDPTTSSATSAAPNANLDYGTQNKGI